MPAYPFIAFLAGESLSAWEQRTARLMEIIARVLVWFTLAVLAVLFVGFVFQVRPEMSRFYDSFVSSVSWWEISILWGCVVYLLSSPVPAVLWNGGPARRLASRCIAAIVILSFFVAEPLFTQQSPRAWATSRELLAAIDLSKHERLYSFGSEAYATSFYLKKPFFTAVAGLPSGSIVFVEQRNVERLKAEISPNIKEVGRFSSGLEAQKKDLVVIEIL